MLRVTIIAHFPTFESLLCNIYSNNLPGNHNNLIQTVHWVKQPTLYTKPKYRFTEALTQNLKTCTYTYRGLHKL